MTVSSTQARAWDEVVALRKIVELYSKLSGLAVQDTELSAVVELVAARIGVSATVIDTDMQVVATAPDGEPDVLAAVERRSGHKALDRLVAAAGRTRRALTLGGASGADSSTVVAPILIGDEVAGFLLTTSSDAGGQTEDVRLVITEHAAMVCSILLGRARVVAAAAGQARRDLFEGLLMLDSNEAEVENWARHLGIKPDHPHHVVSMTFGDGAGDGRADLIPANLADFAVRYLHNRAPEANIMVRGEELVGVFPVPTSAQHALQGLTRLVRTCKEAVEARFTGTQFDAGIGNCYVGAGLIARSYAEARRAVDTGRLLSGLGGVVAFNELGIHRLLVRVRDVADLRDFAHDVLGALIEHDQAKGTDYLTTLTVYFNENGSLQRTGRNLHMHPNSVAYRVRRVEEITGTRLSNYSDRLIVQVALEIANGMGDRL